MKAERKVMQVKTHQGRMAARFVRALAATNGNPALAASFAASQNWADVAPIVGHLKAMVTGMTTDDAALSVVGQDFSAAVRPLTLLGRLQGARRVPLNIRVLTEIGKTSAAFVGQGRPIPVSAADIQGETLLPLSVAGISVVSNELLHASTPSAENVLTEDLSAACAQATDEAFLDPLNAGVADEKPASITYGITPISSTGSTVPQIDDDLEAMVGELVNAGSNLQNAVWIMRPQTAAFLSRLRLNDGSPAYPAITVLGGTLMGLPVLTAGNLPPPGSPALNNIVLLDASQVVIGEDGGATLEVSLAGALEMSDAPTNDSGDATATTMVSLYQTSCAAIRSTYRTNWKLRRPYVSVLAGASY